MTKKQVEEKELLQVKMFVNRNKINVTRVRAQIELRLSSGFIVMDLQCQEAQQEG